MFGLVAVAIVVTYARFDTHELYHVSEGGVSGGFGRALVFLDFPVALAALPMIALAADRLRRRPAVIAVAVAAGLCAVVFWPGVVDQADLDAKPVNVLPAVGVGLALALTVAAGLLRARFRLHIGAAFLAALLLVLAVPWVAADLGFSLAGVPVLGSIWQTGELRHQPGVPGLHPAVHPGHHHGMDGVLLAVAALVLIPVARLVRSRALRVLAGAYLGLQLAYGLANAAQDAWLEQVVKRGWTRTEIPGVLHPSAGLAWLGIVLAACVFTAVVLRREPERSVGFPQLRSGVKRM